MSPRRWLLGIAFVCALASLPGCGAGLIGGIASNSGGGGSGEVRVPELSLDPLLPLVPASNTTRTVVVANAQIAAAAQLRVRIDAAGSGWDQLAPVASGQGGSTLIAFTLDTAPLVAAIGDPTAADVDGRLTVFVDGRAIAAPAPIVLVRQPRAQLEFTAPPTQQFLSPLGERVRIRVTGLRSSDPANVQVLVSTADPTRAGIGGGPRPRITRPCTDVRFEPQPAGAAPVVSAVVPGAALPGQATLFVRDAVAGESTTIENAFYRPDIAVALPSQGPSTGGSLVTLIGTALVPPDLASPADVAPLAFDRLEIVFRKGQRETQLPAEDFRRAESGADRLVFTMPASPDGRPGQVDIVLRVTLGAVTAEFVASRVFLFANPKPFFGPRGAVLDRPPVALVPLFLDAEPGTEATAAPDFAVLSEQGGIGFLQLLLSQQNGMFQPFAAPRRIGDHEVADERFPRDICSGDFNGDHVPDMFLANAGTTTAVHHVVLGRARPATPLGDTFRVPGISASRCRTGDFDADGMDDVVLLPSDAAPAGQVPIVLLARSALGVPAFQSVDLPVRPLVHDAVEIADLDGDGHLDVALFRGTTLQLDVAWGDGTGQFSGGTALDFTIPGYTPDPGSAAIGLHACRNGPQQSLGFVLSGLQDVPATFPTLGILPQVQPRVFTAPVPGTTSILPTEPFGQSLVADLDNSPPVELAVSVAGNPSLISLALLSFDENGWRPVEGGVEIGAELPRQIRALHFGRAFAPTPISPEARAVFVVHESLIDGQIERRLSTRLVFKEGIIQRLLPPDAGAIVNAPIEGLVGGNFHPVSVAGAGLVRDLALARANAIDLIENDGYGGFPRPSHRLTWAGLLPRSMALLPSPAGVVDRLVFVAEDSRVAVWRHDPAGTSPQLPDAVSAPLRTVVPNPAVSSLSVADTTRVRVGDVDGDGIDDLVVLLRFANAPAGDDTAALLLLRGKASPAAGDFPFHQPTQATLVHGNAAAFALGDFAATTTGPVRLELALAVPTNSMVGAIDGDHVRFFRHRAGASPADDVFEPSAAAGGPQVLLAGNAPTRIAAADFDRDGLVDLLVAGAGDSALHLYRNVALPTAGPSPVDVAAFVESLASPQPMAPGQPTALRLADVNGDGNVDAVAVSEFTSNTTGQKSTSVAFFLSTGSGEFGPAQFVSPARVGDRDAKLAFDVGDWNRDGLPDLFLGWSTFAPGDRNLRVLFGGTR
ncbi:MAG: VCBS repeat-containing protein [Planctomycetes bacterium]|nr:VCBS repeat-containing protein [Planctomycetota bacterium]